MRSVANVQRRCNHHVHRMAMSVASRTTRDSVPPTSVVVMPRSTTKPVDPPVQSGAGLYARWSVALLVTMAGYRKIK
jgi:hypothetical protein